MLSNLLMNPGSCVKIDLSVLTDSQVEKLHTEFAAKVARMEEEHSKEVQLLKQELQQMQVSFVYGKLFVPLALG